MLRLALPVLCCAALLWGRPGAEPEPRATRGAPAVAAVEPVTPAGADSGNPSSDTGLGGPDAVPQSDDPPPPGEPLPPDPDELRQHDVRDLVATGLAVDDIALRIEYEAEAKAGSVVARVNVLEVFAPEATQLRVERLLDEKRRIGTRTLRIHPVADLVLATQQDEEVQASLREGTYLPADAFEPLCGPFEIDSLVEVIRQTIGEGVVTITPQRRNLIVLAEPAAQHRIADFLDDLRSNVEQNTDGVPR